MKNCLILLGAVLIYLMPPALWGQTPTSMALVNSGFESGDLTGWSVVASGGSGSGAGVTNNVTNQSAQYPNFYNPLPGTASGTYYGPGTASICYASIRGYTGNPAEVIYQDVSANGQGNLALQPNTTYTLTVAVGVGRYNGPNNGYISLVNGTNPAGTVLASASMSTLGFANYAGTFRDLTVSFTTGSTVSGDLTIAIGTIYGSNPVYLDNIRLTRYSSSLTVVNSGFESGVTTGWSAVASGGYGSGIGTVNNVTNQSAQYPNFSNPLPGTASGSFYGWIRGYPGSPAEILYQDVSANGQGNGPIQPNTTYTLTVAVGVGRYGYPVNGSIALVNGTNPTGTVLATANMNTLGLGNFANNFKDLSVSFTTGNIVSGDLTIEVVDAYGYPSAGAIYLDNIRLTQTPGPASVGGGSLASPASGPPPSFGIGGAGFTIVKNWDFGTNGTITNNTDLSTHFQYHDQFNQTSNPNYGASIVSPDSAHANSGQPYEGKLINGVAVPTVRSFLADSMQTYLVPLGGVATVTPTASPHNAGSGSFQAKWTLPGGGAILGQDIVWETRVRYVTPPYFWFALWTAGNYWNKGAEMDLIESYGYSNGGTNNNFDGDFWHANSVTGTDNVVHDKVSYGSWGSGMSSVGITNFDPTQYHIWTLAYFKDNTYAFYVDGIRVQYGSNYNWTKGAITPITPPVPLPNPVPNGVPINMSFLFDGTWGGTTIANENASIASSALAGTYYEWDYSRVYLR